MKLIKSLLIATSITIISNFAAALPNKCLKSAEGLAQTANYNCEVLYKGQDQYATCTQFVANTFTNYYKNYCQTQPNAIFSKNDFITYCAKNAKTFDCTKLMIAIPYSELESLMGCGSGDIAINFSDVYSTLANSEFKISTPTNKIVAKGTVTNGSNNPVKLLITANSDKFKITPTTIEAKATEIPFTIKIANKNKFYNKNYAYGGKAPFTIKAEEEGPTKPKYVEANNEITVNPVDISIAKSQCRAHCSAQLNSSICSKLYKCYGWNALKKKNPSFYNTSPYYQNLTKPYKNYCGKVKVGRTSYSTKELKNIMKYGKNIRRGYPNYGRVKSKTELTNAMNNYYACNKSKCISNLCNEVKLYKSYHYIPK